MKNILVTGASRGIGYQTALNLAGKGNNVIATARTLDSLRQLESKTDKISIIAADLTTEEGIQSIKEKTVQLGGIDVLINNAGMVLNKPFTETSDADWAKVLDVNFLAPVKLIRKLFPHFNTKAHVVNIGSMGGFQGSDKFAGLAAYSTAKGALAILTECLSAEFSPDEFSINCLCLGAVQTEMLEEAFPGYKAPVNPEDMGNYIAEFALTGHQFMNGKIIPVSLNNPD